VTDREYFRMVAIVGILLAKYITDLL